MEGIGFVTVYMGRCNRVFCIFRKYCNCRVLVGV